MIGFESAPRYAELVRRLTGDSEIVPPGLILELDRPEWARFKSETLWQGIASQGAVAAQFAQVGVRNGPNSNGIVVIVGASFNVGATENLELHLYDGSVGLQLGGISPARARDTRLLTSAAALRTDPLARLGAKTGAIVGVSDFTIQMQNAVFNWLPMTIVLGPNTEAVFAGTVANTTLIGSFVGYSRIMRPEELAE